MLIDHGTFTQYTPATPTIPAAPTSPATPERPAHPGVEATPEQIAAHQAALGAWNAANQTALHAWNAARDAWRDSTAADRRLTAQIEADSLFCRNAADVDWYAIAHATPAAGRHFALIRNGVAVAVDPDPSRLWPLEMQVVEVDFAPQPGWRLVNGDLVDPATIAPTKSELAAYAGEVAWRTEIAGKTILGIPVKWDERSKVLLMGAAGTLADEATAPYVSGSLVVQLTGAQFKSIYAAMVAHTQACFVKRAEVLGQIEAETITTKAQVDAAFT